MFTLTSHCIYSRYRNLNEFGRLFIAPREGLFRSMVGVMTWEDPMFGVLFGIAAGILISNVSVLWLGYLVSEQRRARRQMQR